jgi:hypothetical protein
MADYGWTVAVVDELGVVRPVTEGVKATADQAWSEALSAAESAVIEHPAAEEYRITVEGETATLRPGRTETGEPDAAAALESLAGLREARA